MKRHNLGRRIADAHIRGIAPAKAGQAAGSRVSTVVILLGFISILTSSI